MEPTILWIIGQGILLAGGGVTAYVLLVQRVTRLETLFEIFGRKAAQILHSPHTPELDHYLEKYLNNNMSEEDWKKLLVLVELLENDVNKPREERGLAAIISVHCRKRLRLPLPGMKFHTETTNT